MDKARSAAGFRMSTRSGRWRAPNPAGAGCGAQGAGRWEGGIPIVAAGRTIGGVGVQRRSSDDDAKARRRALRRCASALQPRRAPAARKQSAPSHGRGRARAASQPRCRATARRDRRRGWRTAPAPAPLQAQRRGDRGHEANAVGPVEVVGRLRTGLPVLHHRQTRRYSSSLSCSEGAARPPSRSGRRRSHLAGDRTGQDGRRHVAGGEAEVGVDRFAVASSARRARCRHAGSAAPRASRNRCAPPPAAERPQRTKQQDERTHRDTAARARAAPSGLSLVVVVAGDGPDHGPATTRPMMIQVVEFLALHHRQPSPPRAASCWTEVVGEAGALQPHAL